MNEIVASVLAKLSRRTDLSDEEIAGAFGEILEGRVSDVQAAGLIVALRTKGETTSELAALVRTMRRLSPKVDVADGAIDTCGTGGDRAGTSNISTMAALIAAGAGARVVKHGNRAQSSQCGSADVLEALGVAIELPPEGVARCVAEAGIGFCLAPRYHPAMRFLGPARKELGIGTTFNFIGPLANPAHVKRQAIGVSDETMAARMIGTLRDLGTVRALVFHGDDGLDELTTTTTSTVHELLPNGETVTYSVDPREYGIARANPADLGGGDATANAAQFHAAFAGDLTALRDIAVLNAAAALVVADIAANLEAGIAVAQASLDEGAAAKVLDALVRVSQEEAAAAAGGS
jgi:anthranilate phosphoribosyltransferase